jgi:hypothetical protein
VFVVGDSDMPLSRGTRKIIHVANCHEIDTEIKSVAAAVKTIQTPIFLQLSLFLQWSFCPFYVILQ